MRRPCRAVVLLPLLAVAACGSDDDSTEASDEPTLPPTEGVFDYQLGGAYALDNLAVVDRDASAEPADGAYNICYVNGFQTQPDARDAWDTALLLTDDAGEPVIDPDWPDEYILDPSTEDNRAAILEIIEPVITGCADAGYDAIEIDNLDTYTRFDAIDEDGALELARAYVDAAHELGLAIGQKNAAEIAQVGADDLGFDFALTEECGAYEECDAYTAAYGDRVLQIEYPDSLAEAGISFEEVCASEDRAPLTILRDRDLVTPDDDTYLYESC